jgi:hypothetical protein
MRFSEELEIQSFLKSYDDTPENDRKFIPLEAFAIKAQVGFKELLGAFVISFRSTQNAKSALIAMTTHPEVVRKTAVFAQLPNGATDRRMLHEAVGFLPTAKGTSINFSFGEQGKMPDTEENDMLSAPEINDLFPMITERQEKWQNDRSRLLEEKN